MEAKNFKRVGAIMLSTALAFSNASASIPQLSLFNNESIANTSVTHVSSSPNRVSVHDPSITKSSNRTYYVYGSHTDSKIYWTCKLDSAFKSVES